MRIMEDLALHLNRTSGAAPLHAHENHDSSSGCNEVEV